MNKRKICIVTGTRAEFGLLYWLIKAINDDIDTELQLIVTGMHLSPEFGLTYKEIEKSSIPITKKIEVLLSSDTTVGVTKSMGLAMISFAEAYEQLKPDIVVVLGDRFEIFSATSAAMIARIPIGHIHGGESTEGCIDEPIRHSITKMAHLHFTANEKYRLRVIQLGEQPERVFNTGTPGLDNITKLKLLSKNEFEDSINFNLGKYTALVTFHPVTLEKETAQLQFLNLLNALEGFQDLHIIFTKPNADTDGRIIINLIDEFVKKNSQRSCSFNSLGQLRYLSALKWVNFVIGNSSSGLIEVPSFKIPSINIGDRQRGRMKAKSVINCDPIVSEIKAAISLALSEKYNKGITEVVNPYGTGGASEKIFNIIKTIPLDGIIKKKFYDL